MKSIKYILIVVVALTMALSLWACNDNIDYPLDDKDAWTYQVNDGKATLMSYNGSEETVTIPSSITTKDGAILPVVALNDGLFVVTDKDGVYGENTTLKKVVFESTCPVRVVSNRCFYQCVALESVELNNVVTTIGDFAFYGCESLTSFHFSKRIVSIGAYAFRECKNLKQVYITSILSDTETALNIPKIGTKCFYMINNESKEEDRYYLADDFKIYVENPSDYATDRLENFRKRTKLDDYKYWSEYEGHFQMLALTDVN